MIANTYIIEIAERKADKFSFGKTWTLKIIYNCDLFGNPLAFAEVRGYCSAGNADITVPVIIRRANLNNHCIYVELVNECFLIRPAGFFNMFNIAGYEFCASKHRWFEEGNYTEYFFVFRVYK